MAKVHLCSPAYNSLLTAQCYQKRQRDLVAALGKNDQKIYVVPSLNMVVVRQGNAAGGIAAAASSFDNQLWSRLMDMECLTSNR